MIWRGALLASLLSGTELGPRTVESLARPDRMDPLADELDPDRQLFEQGLTRRILQLESGQADLAVTRETLDLFVPLADRMGMPRHRALLEDASFRLLEPEAHASLVAALAPSTVDDRVLLDRVLHDTEEMLVSAGIDATLHGRTKSLYSTYRKMERKGATLEEITDRIGLRIQVDTVDQCYAVLDALHGRHEALADSFDDYIANPKPNGYQSLHTAVLVAGTDETVEFQIRTRRMHALAEGGRAAHWRYKLSGRVTA